MRRARFCKACGLPMGRGSLANYCGVSCLRNCLGLPNPKETIVNETTNEAEGMPLPRPTMEGWVGSLPVTHAVKTSLIDIIGGVMNGNVSRAALGERALEKATDGYRQDAAEFTAATPTK